MRRMKLVIGNKNYSSWSLRPWLALREAGIPFEEERLSFNDPAFHEEVRRRSPAGKVPVLVDGDLVIWDSLAIAEYVAEAWPDRGLWPEGRAARARARAVCAEMHAGFAELRHRLPFNATARFTGVLLERGVRRDVARIVSLWRDCRKEHGAGGPFLFGRFGNADAYFAPVTRRFVTYGVELPEDARAYVEAVGALPAMQAWLAAAAAEADFVAEDEPYRDEAPRPQA
jgi:glutathione S-transferase